MYKVILWDVDGTVLDFDAAERASIEEGFVYFSLGTCTDEMLEDYNRINKKYWEALERGELEKKEILTGRFEEFLGKYGLDTSIASEFNRKYQLWLGDYIFFRDDAYELLRKLKGKILQFAVTNGTKVAQEKKLKRSELDQIFDDIFISEDLGVEKPNVGFFEKVFDKIGDHDKSQVLIVGDSLTSDIKGGNNFGIKTCWYNSEGKVNDKGLEIDYEIKSLDEVLGIIEV